MTNLSGFTSEIAKDGTWFVRAVTSVRSVLGIVFVIPWTVVACSWTMLAAVFVSMPRVTWLIRGWAIVILKPFGIRVRGIGEKNLPDAGGGILVFNHQSLFDIPCLIASTRKHIRFGAKIELFKIPVFGQAIRKIGTLPIARDNRSEVLRIYRDAEKRFRENIIFVLAPEGTRQREPVIGRFKKGPFIFAVNAKVPIIPVVIKGAGAVMPKKSLGINVGRWFRTVTVQYLPPVPTDGFSLERIEEIVTLVRDSMVKAHDALPAD